MKSLNFNTNIKKYMINNDENNVISVNTADMGIFERVKKSQQLFADVQEKYKEAEKANMIEIMSELDRQVRQQINYIFGSDVCANAFGTANCISFCNGIPMFVGFLNALLIEVREDMQAEQKKSMENVEKYTSQVKK